MRVRDHVAISSAATALLGPLLGRRAVGFWLGGVLVDADHYIWFGLQERRVSPIAAVRFFNAANPPRSLATRRLHDPGALAAVLLLAGRWHALWWVGTGLGLHLWLDAHHEARMDGARAAALRRDRSSCRGCGVCGPQVGTHLWRQPRLLASCRAENLVSLCDRCHVAAHAGSIGAPSWK